MLTLAVLFATHPGLADERCRICPKTLDISGDFHHFKSGDDEEIVGPNFSVTVPDLSPGKYTVIIGESEFYFTAPKQRVFDVTINGKTVASSLDIFAVAGGAKRFVYLANEITRSGNADAVRITRAHLSEGQSTMVTVEIPVRRLRYWDTAGKQYVVEPGDYELLIGAASDEIRLHVPLKIAAPHL